MISDDSTGNDQVTRASGGAVGTCPATDHTRVPAQTLAEGAAAS